MHQLKVRILAPLRGVTIRCFRECFAKEIVAAGFDEAITPFIPAMRGVDPLKDRELHPTPNPQLPSPNTQPPIHVSPQFIGKDPEALRESLLRIKAAGYRTADLNCGCPFPMVRNKGRGSGLLRHGDVLRRMLAVGCEVMGAGAFSVKARLGVERNDELLQLMPMINEFPLRYLTVHARNAKQMYEGRCDLDAFRRIADVAKMPLVYNGDVPIPTTTPPPQPSTSTSFLDLDLIMIGRAFIRALGARADSRELLMRYIEASADELSGDRPVLGRMKELLAYWRDLPYWRRIWPVAKLARTVKELQSIG